MVRLVLLLPIFLATAGPASTTTPVTPNFIAAAVAAPGRDAENVKLDESRKPEQILRWAGLRPGMQAIDLVGGSRYWSEIMAPAVGPKGRVTLWEPSQFLDDKSRAAIAALSARQPNVVLRSSPFEAPDLPANAYDFAMLNLNYHDVYWEDEKFKIKRQDPAAWLKAINRAMKKGATVVVIDHVGKPGPTRETVTKYHRIDPAVVRADFRRAGFALVASSPLLRNPADPHDVLVFDPKVRGKTDRFAFKFRKVR